MFKRLAALCASAKARLCGSIPSALPQGTPQEVSESSDQLLAELSRRLTPKGLTSQLLRDLGLSETTTLQPATQTQETGGVARTEACPRTERDAL